MVSGIINVYKEKGFTSHDVVAKMRGIVGQRKIGHTGTLDPDAVGVLPVCLGKGTKLCDLLTEKDKTYEAVLLLGIETDTQDISGEKLNEKETSHLEETAVLSCIESYVGTYDQIPPMYSALKVNGKKLYELARAGVTVERKARQVCIHEIEVLKMELPRVHIKVSCSKGTYIRTLCHDIGQKLGVGGCMEELLRTKVSMFDIKDSYTLGQLQILKEEGKLLDAVLPVDYVFGDYKKIIIQKELEFLAFNGNKLTLDLEKEAVKDLELVRVYTQEDLFIGIYKYKEQYTQLQLEKMFLDKEQ